MKHKMFLAAGAGVLLAATVFTTLYVKKANSAMDDLFNANAEALSDSESGGCGFAAYMYDDDWYEDTKNFRRCGDCQWVRGTQPDFTNC